MPQKLATVEIIHSFQEHGNADALELAKVLGFQVVVKKGEFKHGDKVVFVWPDTVAEPRPWNKFLRKEEKPVKIKSCKLRGEFSTGLVLPISSLEQQSLIDVVGEDVSLVLGVKKYIKDDGKVSDAEYAGEFPSAYISKTDEDLAQSNPKTQEEFQGKEVYLTTKIDGSSCTFISYDGEISVCSRNRIVKEGDNFFWRAVRKYNMPEKFRNLNVAIQFETAGPKIQKNKLELDEVDGFVFNIKDLDTGKYFGLKKMHDFCLKHGLNMVPVLNVCTMYGEDMYTSMQDLADRHKYPNGSNAEGIVMRPTEPSFSPTLGKMLSVKFINRNYKD